MIFKRLLFERYLGKNETLLYTIHRHWIKIYRQMLKIAVFGYLIPGSLLLFITGLSGPVSYFFYVWIVLSFAYSVYAFLDWYLDAWLLTDISIIDTQWDGFFKQRSSRIDYESIESVDIEVKGVKQTLLNFGHIVLIKSSGINITMECVSKPQLASTWLSRIMTEVSASKNTQNAESIKSLLADIIQDHIRVNS